MTTFESEMQSMTSDLKATDLDFDLQALRFLVAIIALSLPPLVYLITLTITSSISASYYTNARDPFVGCLFVIGALFWAYEGHSEPKVCEREESPIEKVANRIGGLPRLLVGAIANAVYKIKQALYKVPESLISKIGGTAAMTAALFPTACDFCNTNSKSVVHYVSAAILFSAIVYFCLIAFPYQTKVKLKKTEMKKARLEQNGGKDALPELHRLEEKQKKQERRIRFYIGCGLATAAVMLALIISQSVVPEKTRVALHLTYWAEFIALWLFGFAWSIASKVIPYFAHEDERYRPFGQRGQKET